VDDGQQAGTGLEEEKPDARVPQLLTQFPEPFIPSLLYLFSKLREKAHLLRQISRNTCTKNFSPSDENVLSKHSTS